MGVEAVHDVKHGGIFRGLNGQIGCAAAAQDHNVYFVFPRVNIVRMAHGCACGQNFYRFGVSAGEYRLQFHIGILPDGAFHTAAKIAITDDADSDAHCILFLSYSGFSFISHSPLGSIVLTIGFTRMIPGLVPEEV